MTPTEKALRVEIAELRQILDNQATANAIMRDRIRTMAKNVADDIARLPTTRWENPGMGFDAYLEDIPPEQFKAQAIEVARKHGEP